MNNELETCDRPSILDLMRNRWQRWKDRNRPGNLELHALRELRAIGYVPLDLPQENGPNKWIQNNVIELIRVFSKQGHSGMSASYCISMFEKLARFEPLGPLTGADDEWNEVGEGMLQNNRCSHVFKGADGRAYDIDGRIFREPDGGCYIRDIWSVGVCGSAAWV